MAMPSPPHQQTIPGTLAVAADQARPSTSRSTRGPGAKRRPHDDGRRAANNRRNNDRSRAKTPVDDLSQRPARTRGASTTTLDAPQSAGRSFTVGNINNGIIYLRPVIRPGNQRNRPVPDPFVYPPATPPDSAPTPSLDDLSGADSAWRETLFSGTELPTHLAPPLPHPPPRPPSPSSKPAPAHVKTPGRTKAPKESPQLPKRPVPARSSSFSAGNDLSTSSTAPDPGTFKVIIERPSLRRPRTADTGSLPVLEVPIPHYRLGTPRFSVRGTAILRSSVYTRTSATDDFRSSAFSYIPGDNDRLFPSPLGHRSSYFTSRRHSEVSPHSMSQRHTTMLGSALPSSARTSAGGPIEPQMYDLHTTNPEDPSVVRFSPSGEIIAATPSRLIAHITSPSFVDYDLLGHFFLTFRSFLTVTSLLTYLVARLRWAVNRADDFGRIVRVRTFVALRHWILNYFIDDFLPDYIFREYFCTLVNKLHEDLRNRADGGGGDLKIVSELKRCWRRTCAEYWDANTLGLEQPDEPIVPGGKPASTSSRDTVMAPLNPTTPKKQVVTKKSKPDAVRVLDDIKQQDWFRDAPLHHSVTSANLSSQRESQAVPLSPSSDFSMQVMSCSIPMRSITRAEPDQDIPLYPHPVPAHVVSSSQYQGSIRPIRKGQGHKRSGSFSDALRDSRGPLPLRKNSIKETRVSPATPPSNLPGSLVRGAVFQPGSPYIDIKNPVNLISRSNLEVNLTDLGAVWTSSKGTSPGMKRIFGSVRRALGSKQHIAGQHSVGSATLEPSITTSANRASYSATVDTTISARPSHRKKPSREQNHVRIDLLTARVGETFRQAIASELELEKQGRRSLLASNIGNMESFVPKIEPQDASIKPDTGRLNSAVTAGSRSIVIVDDTAAPPLPLMSGALPVSDPASVNNFSRPLTAGDKSATKHRMTYHSTTHHEQSSSSVTNRSERSAPSVLEGSAEREGTKVSSRMRTSSRTMQRPSSSFQRRASTRSVRSDGSLKRYTSFSSSVQKADVAPASSAPGPSQNYTESSDNDSFPLERPPIHRLRRRPGGDLRAADNVHELEGPIRPHSAGSISIRTHSIASSAPLTSGEVPPFRTTQHKDRRPSTTMSDEGPRRRLSLMDTHSSQPNLRPSFEAEVAKLAALPDDDDDGGVESALMKLEGRYEKKSPDPRGSPVSPIDEPFSATEMETLEGIETSSLSITPPPTAAGAQNTGGLTTGQELDALVTPKVGSNPGHQHNLDGSHSIVGSEDSYNSVPLLERGLSDAVPTRRRLPHPQDSPSGQQPLRGAGSPDSSMEYIEETDSMKRIPRGDTAPLSFKTDDEVDLSRETFDLTRGDYESDGASQGVRSFFSDEPANLEPEGDAPFHPLRHPPTPPLTTETLAKAPTLNTTQFQKGLPTPGLSPVSRGADHALQSAPSAPPPTATGDAPITAHKESKDIQRSSQLAHLPFIMAYDSELLAQQFTIIEKDALDEIDWKELIELRWRQSSPHVKDWVEYLRTQEPKGVDVVIARFNLMVKWVVSEILLTENIEERVKVVVKFIHIAFHARRLRNYATMYQIAVALLSSYVTRLSRTWELVSPVEKRTLGQLEELVQPVRNFHNLRVEMETSSLEEGCIPFIGIYTRDLVYNGQKPEFLGDSPTNSGEWLVNFERCHVAASIVKGLLRLLEASSNYRFQPDSNIISKCLWIASLSDDELNSVSKKLE